MKGGLIAAVMAMTAFVAIAMDSRVPPLFSGSVMTNETVLFMGTDDAAPLMYRADEILSVTSFDLKTNYVEGVDWTFDAATHTIRPTANTRMPYYTEAEWYPESGRFACNVPGKAYVFFSEGSVISLHQVCVTYRHSDSWEGPAPCDDSAAFTPMLAELAARQGGKTLFYGDSITTGANSSGRIGFDPYIPSWPEQVHAEIVAATGNTGLEYVNTAVGGKNTQWGLDNVQERVIAYAPDFVLIAFGMNDTLSAADYSSKHEAMVNAIHAALPNAAVMLVSPMVPNLETTSLASRGTLFPQYEQELVALVAKFRAAGFARIGCASVNTMHAAVLAKKRFRDMTGNNVNHCNDFSARIYRDTILAAMGLPKNPVSNWKPRRTGKVRGWFDGGVAAGWPNAASKFGGDWRNPQDGEFSQGALRVQGDQAMLDFTAERAVEVLETNVVISARREFLPLTEPPLAPADALAAVTAVWEGSATNYWGLVKGGNGAGVWRRIPGLRAKVDVPVDVEIEFAYEAAGTRVQYRLDGEASEWMETAVESVGGVGVRGTLHSLAGRCENLVPSNGLVIRMAGMDTTPPP